MKKSKIHPSIKREYARRIGDRISIPGDYQFRVLHHGPTPQRFWHHAKIMEAERWLSPNYGDVILDVGCGSGVLAARLAEHSGTEVIGIDANEDAIRFSKQKFSKPNLSFYHGLIDDINLQDNFADKIAFLEVIEHISLEQASEVINNFYRYLRHEGRLVITTPNANSLWPFIEWTLDSLRLVPHMAEDQHVIIYRPVQIVELGQRAGFNLVTCRSINWIAPWLALFSWRLALTFHKWEQTKPHTLGSILLLCFEKP